MNDEERYEIRGKLGEGGRGSVYEAYDHQLNRKVAIKRLHPGDDMDPTEAYETVLKESHALSALNSPNIVRVFDVGHDDDGAYVVMEHLDGKTLHEVVAKAPLVEADFFSIAEQSLEALVAAHAAGLLHRDIKPANLVLTWLPSGRIMLKLLDFGLAKFTTAPAVQTVAHGSSVLGSIYFMAPEQFDRHPLDERTDLYSLGCVFYFALTGLYPFTGDNVTEIMASHVTGNRVDLKTERPDLPPDLCDWIMSMSAKDPADRPASAREALTALEAFKKASLTRTSAVPTKTVPLPVATGPLTATVPAATGPLTGTAPVATGPLMGTAPAAAGPVPTATVSTPLRSPGGMPKSFYIIVGVLGFLILGVVAAIVVRSGGNSNAPAAAPEEPVAAAPGEPAASPPEVDEEFQKDLAALRSGASSRDVPKKNQPQNLDFPKRFLRKRDTDNDGELTYNEYFPVFDQKLRKAERKRFDNFDLDDSGTLNLEEIREKAGGVAQFFVRDKNDDMKLTLKEWLAFRTEKGKETQTGTFKNKDADGDGFMTLQEFRTWKKPPDKGPAGE